MRRFTSIEEVRSAKTPYEVLANGNINDKVISFTTIVSTMLLSKALKCDNLNGEGALDLASMLRDTIALISDADLIIRDGTVMVSNYNEEMDTASVSRMVEASFLSLKVNADEVSMMVDTLETGMLYLLGDEGNTITNVSAKYSQESVSITVDCEWLPLDDVNQCSADACLISNQVWDFYPSDGFETWLEELRHVLDKRLSYYILYPEILGMHIINGAYDLHNDGWFYHDNDKCYSLKGVNNIFTTHLQSSHIEELVEVEDACLNEYAEPPEHLTLGDIFPNL